MYWNPLIPELAVRDLKASIAFYQTLGFKKNYERIEDKFVFFSLGKAQLMLQEITPHEKWQVTKELTYPYGAGINFQIEVKNVDILQQRLIEAGYPIAFPMEENWYRQGRKWLGNKEFLVQDPDGYLLRFSQDLGKKKRRKENE